MRTRTALKIGAGACLLTVLALMHTPTGYALWGRLRGTTACPFGMDATADPVLRDGRRLAEAQRLRGSGRARSQGAIFFRLNSTTRAEVARWEAARVARCVARPTAADLACEVANLADDPAQAGPGGTVFMAFDRHDRLKHIWVQAHYADAENAAADFVRLQREITAKLGAAPLVSGEPTPAFLAAAPLRQAAAEYRSEDVYARLAPRIWAAPPASW